VTEAPPEADDHRDSAPAAAAPRRRGGGGLAFALLLLIATGLAGLYLWNELQRARGSAATGEAWRLEAEALAARLDSLDRRLQQLSAGQRAIDARLGEVGANQGVIRAELLAAGERAATIEDAVARLSDQRLRGDTQLKLNEIEGLLVLAEQRLSLARDLQGARAALQSAAQVLVGLDDPLFAGLQLPLAAERELLAQLPPDPLPSIRATLGAALTALPSLPRQPLAESAKHDQDPTENRLLHALSGLVQVRTRGEGERALAGSAREAALEALRLDLRAALAAAESRDPDALEAALERARLPFARLFDGDAATVRALRARLESIEPEALRLRLPELGATLGELRALRGNRRRLAPPLSDPSPEAAGVGTHPAAATPPAQAPATAPELDLELELEPEARPEADPASTHSPDSAPAGAADPIR
jgi:uroporphyrin-III C-methyltransferase